MVTTENFDAMERDARGVQPAFRKRELNTDQKLFTNSMRIRVRNRKY